MSENINQESASSFSDLASSKAKEKTLEYHKNGMNSLGLTI